MGLSNHASAPLKHLELRDPGLLGADFVKSGPENSMGKEMKLEAGGFEAAEVGVQGGEGKSGADGEGCEVSVHPDFGRSGRDGGELEPEFAGAFGFGIEAVDVRCQRSNPARLRASSSLACSIIAWVSFAVGGTKPGVFSVRDTAMPVLGSIT